MRPASLEIVRSCWERVLRAPGDGLVIVRLGDVVIARASDNVSGRAGVVRAHAWLAYTDAAPTDAAVARALRLDAADPRLARFAASLTREEWEESGLARGAELAVQFGVSAGYDLAAVAGYEIWDGCVAHLCVASAPEERGRGYAKTAAAAATAHALDAGLVAQWRSSAGNERSAGLAAALGFERIGEQLVVGFS